MVRLSQVIAFDISLLEIPVNKNNLFAFITLGKGWQTELLWNLYNNFLIGDRSTDNNLSTQLPVWFKQIDRRKRKNGKKLDTNKNFKTLKAQAELNCSQSYFVKRQGIGKKSETKCCFILMHIYSVNNLHF